jgi:hypothetical protein
MRAVYPLRLAVLGFFFFFRPRTIGTAAVEKWESRVLGEIPKGRWERWETCLWFSTSTGRVKCFV